MKTTAIAIILSISFAITAHAGPVEDWKSATKAIAKEGIKKGLVVSMNPTTAFTPQVNPKIGGHGLFVVRDGTRPNLFVVVRQDAEGVALGRKGFENGKEYLVSMKILLNGEIIRIPQN